jgi:hypothetical protein
MHVILRREIMIKNCVDVLQSVSPREIVWLRERRVWSVEVATTTSSDG